MKRLALLLTLVLLLCVPLQLEAVYNTNDYQFTRSLSVAQQGFALIPLDQEVMANSRDDLADIRLIDANNIETPYQPVPLGSSSSQTRPATVYNQSTLNSEFRFTLDLGSTGLLHNQILMQISSDKDYLGDLYLEGSDDQEQWSAIKSTRIFNVNPNYCNQTFSYPASSWRFIRVRIASQPLPRLSLYSIKISYLPQANQLLTDIHPIVASQSQAAEGKTQVILDMSTKGCYIHSIILKADDRNYQRPVQVFSSNTLDNWLPMGGGTIHHFNWSGYEAREEVIPVNQSAKRYLKLEIQDGSSPPLNIQEISVKGSFPYLLADLKPGNYQLYYGYSKAEPPQYDLARFSNLIDTSTLPIIKPGLRDINPAYRPPVLPWTERNRWLLNAAVVLAVLVMAVLFIRNMRRV